MNRRSFLSGLLGAVGAATLDPEELLWKPSKKIFIPPPPKTLNFHKNAFWLGFDPAAGKSITRMDTLYGWAPVAPAGENPVVMDVLSAVDMEWSEEELLMTMDDFRARYFDFPISVGPELFPRRP